MSTLNLGLTCGSHSKQAFHCGNVMVQLCNILIIVSQMVCAKAVMMRHMERLVVHRVPKSKAWDFSDRTKVSLAIRPICGVARILTNWKLLLAPKTMLLVSRMCRRPQESVQEALYAKFDLRYWNV